MTRTSLASKSLTRTLLALTAAAMGLLAAACGSSNSGGGSSPPPPPPPPIATGALKQAATADEFETALKAGFTTAFPANIVQDSLAASPAAGNGTAFSGTYTQEVNVDEFDAVRYDGEHLYVAPRRYLSCCFILSPTAATNTAAPPTDSIRILSTDSSAASATPVSSIPLKANVSVQGMYVEGDTLFALTAETIYGAFGPFWSDIAIWLPEKFGYQVYDVQDRSQPVPVTDVSIDGIFVDSRRIGDTVYIISRYLPVIQNIIYSPADSSDVTQNQATLASVSLDDMLPTITIDGNVQPLVDPLQCYVPNDDEVRPYPVITSITAIPVNDPTKFENTCYNSDAYGAYVSETSVYMTQLTGSGIGQPLEIKTRIHKFALSGTGADYRGSGDVPGVLWRGGQSDFRMSEADGDLRVLSSQFNFNSNDDFVDHHLSVLRESAGVEELSVVGQLPNAANPDPIGKPNELLFGVRFLGDRAYAVTFERIDPLYVFDLSDPTNPAIAGELEVEGFSDFLHPVNDDLLLGLGAGAMGGVKLELFDVSDMSMPLSRGEVTIGQAGAYSEARHNRHAFAYLVTPGGVDRFTVPVSEYDFNTNETTTGLHLFEIRDKTTPDLASLVPVGAITPPSMEWVDRNRAYIHDDAVFYVQGETVWSAFWSTPTMVNGPF